MEYNEIGHLYKFYSFNTNSLSVLINNTVWFSKPAALNDPFDIDIDFAAHPMTASGFKHMIQVLDGQAAIPHKRADLLRQLEREIPEQKALDEMNQVMAAKFREDRKDRGVFCLSESWNNICMWSHYADKHRGFCVRFARNANNRLGDVEYTRPVLYSCDYPSPDPYSVAGRERSYDQWFFTKAKCWGYEKEWRMLNDEGDKELPVAEFTTITGIIFGLSMPKAHRETVRRILSDKKEIEFLEAVKVPNKFELEIVQC
jgi:hypothetical protein